MKDIQSSLSDFIIEVQSQLEKFKNNSSNLEEEGKRELTCYLSQVLNSLNNLLRGQKDLSKEDWSSIKKIKSDLLSMKNTLREG